MRPHDFSNALVRMPGRSVVQGLRAVDHGQPSFEGVASAHGAYVRALEDAGVKVEVLPALEAYPDSIFVEDPALVFGSSAIGLRLAAPTRFGETDEIMPALERRFERVLRVGVGTVEGGDVLATPRGVYIGRSARTDSAGAQTLIGLLAELDLNGVAVATPPGVLHFKSECALLDEETVLSTARLASTGVFAGLRTLLALPGEEAAANAVRINDRVLMSAQFPRTAEIVSAAGYDIVALDTSEIAKIDAGLSCMSLRWRA